MNLKKDFDKLYNKYNTILSLNELYYFNNQLNKIGYSIFVERVDNKIIINYNKPNIIDFFKRLKYYINPYNLKLENYQKLIYKIN
jgi:hypothetical protein